MLISIVTGSLGIVEKGSVQGLQNYSNYNIIKISQNV